MGKGGEEWPNENVGSNPDYDRIDDKSKKTPPERSDPAVARDVEGDAKGSVSRSGRDEGAHGVTLLEYWCGVVAVSILAELGKGYKYSPAAIRVEVGYFSGVAW